MNELKYYRANIYYYVTLFLVLFSIVFFSIIFYFADRIDTEYVIFLSLILIAIIKVLITGFPADFAISAQALIVYGWKVKAFRFRKVMIQTYKWEQITEYFPFVAGRSLTAVVDGKKKRFGFAPMFYNDFDDLHDDIVRYAHNAEISG